MTTPTTTETEGSATTQAGARTHAELIAKATEIVPTATTTLFKVRGKWFASRQPTNACFDNADEASK